MSGRKEGVLQRAAELVVVDEGDQRRDPPALLRHGDHDLLLVRGVRPRRRPRAGRARLDKPAHRRHARGGGRPLRDGAGREEGRDGDPGLAAVVAGLAEGGQQRRDAVGRQGGERLLGHRLDQIGAGRADDRPRDALGAALVAEPAQACAQAQEGCPGVEVAADVGQALRDLGPPRPRSAPARPRPSGGR
jgi:hypothetical protein